MTSQHATEGSKPHAMRPGALAIFSYAWAAQSLVQMVYFSNWFYEGWIAGYIFTAASIMLFLFPGRIWTLVPMLVSCLVYYFLKFPFVANHVMIEPMLAIAMLGALVMVKFKGKNTSDPLKDDWFLTFAPVLGTVFSFMYVAIIISKMNWGFFDLEVSCLTGMIEEAHATRPLVSPLLGLASVETFFWVFIVAETLLPIMLFFKRTRLAAYYFGVPFHVLLGLMGHWPFSSFMLALYVLVAAPAMVETVGRYLPRIDAIRERIAPAIPPHIAFAAINALLLLAAWPLKPSIIWILWTLPLVAALLYSAVREHRRSGIFGGTGVIEFATTRPGVLWLILGLAIINASGQYLGFKTQTNVAMYSNLRSDTHRNNHIFLPVVPVFGYTGDLVEIVDSNNPEILQLQRHQTMYGFENREFDVYRVFYEFRRAVQATDDPDLEVTYRRNGELRTYKRGAPDNVDTDLEVHPNLLESKILYMRPIYKGDRDFCLH